MFENDVVKSPTTEAELRPGKGITVTYDEIETQARFQLPRGGWALALFLLCAIALGVAAGAAGYYFHETRIFVSFVAIAIGTIMAGLNTITYDANGSIPAGTTAPTAAQSFNANVITAVITGDGATTTFAVVHNWGISASGITAACPWVFYEQLLASGYTAAPLIVSRATNQVNFQVTAFTGAGLRVRLCKPYSPDDNQHF